MILKYLPIIVCKDNSLSRRIVRTDTKKAAPITGTAFIYNRKNSWIILLSFLRQQVLQLQALQQRVRLLRQERQPSSNGGYG